MVDAASLLGRPVENDNGAMDSEPKRKRRWYQFRLRTLLIGVTLVAACAYVGRQAKIVRERQAWRANPRFWEPITNVEIIKSSIPWIRRLLGDSDCICITAVDGVTDTELDACRSAFPEADVPHVGDHQILQGRHVERRFRNGVEMRFRNGEGEFRIFDN
jgi:hypothetical protein